MAKKEDNKQKGIDLGKNLEALSEIADWFDDQEEVDVEEGLQKVKTAAGLIKESKVRLNEIENEFEEIKKDIEAEIDADEDEDGAGEDESGEDEDKEDDDGEDEKGSGKGGDIPF